MSPLTFSVYAFRFHFAARGPVHFPPGSSGNIIRGAFGTIFRRLACVPECPGARDCELRAGCPYARIFEPVALEKGPSGLADLPRPFVFRAAHLDGRHLLPGEAFHFDLHLFYPEEFSLAYFVLSFAELAREGLGPGRARAELISVDQLDADKGPPVRIYHRGTFVLQQAPAPLELDLSHDAGAQVAGPGTIGIRFVTPTELKSEGRIVTRPEFPVLFARIRDRISTLRAMYGPGPLPIDFQEMRNRSESIRLTGCRLTVVSPQRRSTKTGQQHSIGGFVGEVAYEGDVAEFVPYLRAAKWTGVGRQTVWGKGVLEIVAVSGG